MVLRIKDVSYIKPDKTAKLQQQILIANGVVSEVNFEIELSFSNWSSVVSLLAKNHPIISLEDENDVPIY